MLPGILVSLWVGRMSKLSELRVRVSLLRFNEERRALMDKLKQAWTSESTIEAIPLCSANWNAVSGFPRPLWRGYRKPIVRDVALASLATLCLTIVRMLMLDTYCYGVSGSLWGTSSRASEYSR